MTPKLKKIILTMLGIIILFVAYVIFIKKNPAVESLVNANEGLSGDARLLGNQISQALLRIEQIKLDRDIFNNAIYKTLVDRSEPITEEPIGRVNPFAPIGDISISSNTKPATSTQIVIPTATSTTNNNIIATSTNSSFGN